MSLVKLFYKFSKKESERNNNLCDNNDIGMRQFLNH